MVKESFKLNFIVAKILFIMAKKDIDAPIENIDRDKEALKEAASGSTDQESIQQEHKTEVKNAHASGLGSIGRNDHRLDDIKPDFDNY
jgi:hypothetical protein